MSNQNEPNDRPATDTGPGNPPPAVGPVASRDHEGPADEAEPGRLLTSRRRLLASVSVAPIAVSLAGCQADVSGEEGRTVPEIEPGDTVPLGDAVRFGKSYAMAVTLRSGSGETREVIGRFHGDDHFVRTSSGVVETESYIVDGTGYLLVDGECTEYPELDTAVDGIVEVSDDRPAQVGPMELAVTGTETIKGRKAYRLESTEGRGVSVEEPVTYFVDADTRHIRRIELGNTAVDYHSWNEVDPVEPPDMDCSPEE